MWAMPTYTYACSACAHRFDATQSIHDDALTTCPECAGALRRVISPAGVSFKGSGFYRTDSRAPASKAAAPAASGAGSSSGSASGSSASTGATSS